jgi:hypothetical protein
VVRRLLLAVLFCLAGWALADRTPANTAAGVAADATTVATNVTTVTTASIGATVATPPIETHPPEARWEALLPQGMIGGSSRSHQPQAQAVSLPGVSSRVPWPITRRTHAARHAAQFRPPHLTHTPLLI